MHLQKPHRAPPRAIGTVASKEQRTNKPAGQHVTHTLRRSVILTAATAITALAFMGPAYAVTGTVTPATLVRPAFSSPCVTVGFSQGLLTKTYSIRNSLCGPINVRVDLANHADISCTTLHEGGVLTITVAATASLRDVIPC